MATSSQNPPLEWTEKYNNFNKFREQGYIQVDRGLNLENEGKPQEAIASYEAGLQSIDRALNIYLENVSHSLWDQYYENVTKMKGTRKMVLSRLTDLQNPGVPDNGEIRLDPSAPLLDRGSNAPPSYDEAMASSTGSSESGSGLASPTSPYAGLSSTLEQLKMEAAGKVIYMQEGVRMYFIAPDGQVGSLSSPASMTIAQYQGVSEREETPRYYLQVGDWMYPLVPGLSPILHSEFGAFIIPDVHSPVEGSAVGLLLPDGSDSTMHEILNDILQGIMQEPVKVAPGVPPPRPPPPRIPGEAEPLTRKISKGIIIGAQYLSEGLVKGAEKAGELISSATPKVMAKMQPEPEPTPVPPNVQKSMKVAKNVTGVAVQVTATVASKIGSATMALGRWMAPHIQSQGTKLLSRMSGLNEQEAAGKVGGALEVTAGAVQGVGTVYTALEKSASILAHSLANNTVQIVQYKYGQPVGEVTGDTLYTVGNAAVAGYNASSLTVKGISKRAAKNAGKAVLEDYTPKDVKQPPDEGDDGAGPSEVKKGPL